MQSPTFGESRIHLNARVARTRLKLLRLERRLSPIISARESDSTRTTSVGTDKPHSPPGIWYRADQHPVGARRGRRPISPGLPRREGGDGALQRPARGERRVRAVVPCVEGGGMSRAQSRG